jgi:MFS family permease
MSTAPLAGYFSDVLRSRWRVISYAFFVGCIAMILLALDSPVLIIIGFLCSAVVMSSVQSLTITLTGDLVETEHRGKAISLLHTVGDFGSAVGPPCAYALLFSIGLTGIYLLCAGLFVLALCLIILREKKIFLL